MKRTIKTLIEAAVLQLQQQGKLPSELTTSYTIERARDKQHGDFATNVALVLAKSVGMAPRELAAMIIAACPPDNAIERIDIAGPGFINFYCAPSARWDVVAQVLNAKQRYGTVTTTQPSKVQIEFVSSNPTGPLHVGHGRGAAYGSAVANLLEAAGYQVDREYYVNDAGRQMDILIVSVWLRYLSQYGEKIPFPANAYQGEYICDIASGLIASDDERWRCSAAQILPALPLAPEAVTEDNKDAFIDGLIAQAKVLLGEEYLPLQQKALAVLLADIREDLSAFAVEYQRWFSERQLITNGALQRAITKLQQGGHTYEQAGALWFRSTAFGDDKDRVLVRDNGQATYFASDVAYHADKFERGYDWIIDVLGADHHGYVPRVKAAIQALGYGEKKFSAPIVQFATLYRGKERVQMSTRSGEFVTLRALREEVGTDAARFFYLLRKSEQHMDFDLQLATSRTNENPVYYVQYAHARICSVFKQLEEKNWLWEQNSDRAALSCLDSMAELQLLDKLARYPETVASASEGLEPHLIVHFLRELANDFHSYYNAQQFLVDDHTLRNARLCLIAAVKQVLQNGLNLLGVSAPRAM